MSEIRPFRRDDVGEVAELYRDVDRSDWRIPPHELPAWLERTLFDHPWVDPEIPGLVYVDEDGRISGFVASHVRRMRLDGRPLRMAAAGPLIAHPRVRNRGVGALLWRSFLAGPQELTITDGASDEMRAIFERIGGHMLHPSCVAWARVYRPWEFAGGRALSRTATLRERVKPRLAPVWSVLDRPTTRGVPYFRAPAATGTTSEQLTPEAMLEHLGAVTRRLRLVPDYDAPFLRWLFAELHHNRTWGEPVRRLVRDADGRPIGWYVYFLAPGEGSQVLQVAAHPLRTEAVLDDLLAHAVAHGAAAVQGRVEPHLLAPIAHRGAAFRYSPRSLVHAKDTELLGILAAGEALLTRLEGEWWMAT